jgi:hypothetical protein
MEANPQPQRVARANQYPEGLRKYMPYTGEYGEKLVANDRVMYVDGVPPSKIRCHVIARYMLHAAQDGGFGIICVLRGPNHKHEFKVLDMVRKVKKWTGPSLVGLTKFRDDCWLDERKKIWVLGHQPNPEAKISTS